MAIKLPEVLQTRIDKLEDKQKQWLLYGSIIVAFGFVVWIFSDDTKTTTRTPSAPPPVADILTDADTRRLGIDSIGSRTIRLETEANQLRSEIESLRQAMAARESQQVMELRANEEAIAARIRTDLLQEIDERNAAVQATQQGPDPFALAPAPAPPPTPVEQFDEQGNPIQPAPAAVSAPASPGIRIIKPAAPTPTAVPVSLDGADLDETPAKPMAFIPAGSIITGHLLTGIDAPTHKAARAEPYPVTIRVTMESILPSLRRYDLSECFIVAGGFGDLSSERALFRTDLITCIGADGESVEAPIKAFVVGEDGKNGLRGRLVSKQGALIARSLAAGFAEGFSTVFRQAQVPVIANAGTGGSAQFQNLVSAGSLQSAGASGIGSALDRLSQYYLDLANEMHAIIEIDAARDIEIVLLEGISFPDLHDNAFD